MDKYEDVTLLVKYIRQSDLDNLDSGTILHDFYDDENFYDNNPEYLKWVENYKNPYPSYVVDFIKYHHEDLWGCIAPWKWISAGENGEIQFHTRKPIIGNDDYSYWSCYGIDRTVFIMNPIDWYEDSLMSREDFLND
jgi:hypothetical protein